MQGHVLTGDNLPDVIIWTGCKGADIAPLRCRLCLLTGLADKQQLSMHTCSSQDAPTLDKFAERLIQNVLGATETTFGLMLALFCVVQTLPGLQVRRACTAIALL